jgi:hypothetical protein
MYIPIPVEEWIAALPIVRQKAIEARGKELIAKVRRRMTPAELRKGRKISQATVAEALESARCRFRGLRSGRTRGCRRCSGLWRRWADN